MLIFLAPEQIPIDLLFAKQSTFPNNLTKSLSDPLVFDDYSRALRNVSLIGSHFGEVYIHRMVQDVCRDRLSSKEYIKWLNAALSLVNNVFPLDSAAHQTWEDCDRLLAHALSVL